MDNFTHSLAGWALGQAGLKTRTRKGLAALILGANAPDIDVFFQWAPWEPLATHRGFTHSLVGGVLILPLMLWGLLIALDAWQVKRGSRFRSGLAIHKGWLLALCYIGTLTHPLLDLQNTYSVQLLSPLSGGWFHSDGLFIIDALLWTVVPLSIAWSRMRERQGRSYAGVVRWALSIVLVYLCFNIGFSKAIMTQVRTLDSCGTPDAIYAGPAPVLFWKRDVIWRRQAGTEHPDSRFAYGHASYDLFRGWSGLGEQMSGRCMLQPDHMRAPIVERAIAANPRLEKFLYWSTSPTAEIAREGCIATVTLGDARFSAFGRRSRLYRGSKVDLCQ